MLQSGSVSFLLQNYDKTSQNAPKDTFCDVLLRFVMLDEKMKKFLLNCKRKLKERGLQYEKHIENFTLR